MKTKTRQIVELGLLSLITICGLSSNGFATSVSFSSVDLDLDDPATGNNRFVTVFRVTEPGSGTTIEGGPVTVDYFDDNQTGMQVNLDIDFADPQAPVVQSIEFVGEPGDITHGFGGDAIDVQFNNGLLNIDLDATPNGVKGFLRTQGGPIAVAPDGSFDSGNTNLVARQGTVDIEGTISSFLGSLLVDETFSLADTPLDQFNDSISDGSTNTVTADFVGIDSGDLVYDVTVTTILENTLLPFSASGFDLVLDITGVLQGTGQVRVSVPEPASVSLVLGGIVLGLCRRIRASR